MMLSLPKSQSIGPMGTKTNVKFIVYISIILFLGYNFRYCMFNSKSKCPSFIINFLSLDYEIKKMEPFVYNELYTHPKYYLFKIKAKTNSNIIDQLVSNGFIPYTSLDTFKIKNNDYSTINSMFNNWARPEIIKKKVWWGLSPNQTHYFVKPIFLMDTMIVERNWQSKLINGRILIEPIDSFTAFGFIEEKYYWKSNMNISIDSIENH